MKDDPLREDIEKTSRAFLALTSEQKLLLMTNVPDLYFAAAFMARRWEARNTPRRHRVR